MRYYQNMPIKQWVAEDRPREKVMEKGVSSLTEAELIAILLSTGTRELSAIDLGRSLLQSFGGLRQLAQASIQDLMDIRGIGKAKATCLVSAFELARRRLKTAKHAQLNHAESIAEHLRPYFIDLNHEQFHVLYLNRNNQVLGHKVISTGGVNATVIDPRLIFKEAMQFMASALVLSHNHPSGTARPSAADDHVTERLVLGAELLDMRILDHIIISENGFYSYADHGDLAQIRLNNSRTREKLKRSSTQGMSPFPAVMDDYFELGNDLQVEESAVVRKCAS